MTDTRLQLNRYWKLHDFALAALLAFLTPGFVSVVCAQSLEVDQIAYSTLLYFNADVSGTATGVDLKNANNSGLVVLGADIKGTDSGGLAAVAIANAIASADAAIQSEIIGKVLFYPNPVRQVDEPKLWYTLSKNMDIEIRIYDMLARLMVKFPFPAGTVGGKAGTNVVHIKSATFDSFQLSSGVYFAVIMSEGRVLGKGKVAILP